ncbi:MAG: methylmalonyl-CoA epimerase [Acidobacteria bacterium]|nr:methylmalonyl-CoA epimerase [Acidobacteriota bacterium]
MIRRLDHVGVAVRKASQRLPFYRDLLGLPLAKTEEVPSEQVRITILGEGPGRVELLEPTAEDSPVGRFLRERGEGIHHLCFLVDSLEATCERLQASGYRLAGGIRAGSEGTLIAFLHPKDVGGVLIELREVKGVQP